MAETFTWTDQRINALRRLIDAGLSGLQIAAELSREFDYRVTRNMVIGKASRLGWSLLTPAFRPSTARELTPARPSRLRGGAAAPVPKRSPQSMALVPAKPARGPDARHAIDAASMTRGGWPKPANPESVNFWGLTSKACRLPLWSDAAPPPFEAQMYCGRPVAHEGSSWCAGCRTILFTRGTLSEQRADDIADLERRMRRPVGAW